MRPVNKIIIHCSATELGNDYSLEEIRRWHLLRGFNDVGYHYIIQTNGYVLKGRPLSKVGAHCYGYNKNSIGVCYIGGLHNGKPCDTRTKEQKHALRELIASLKRMYPGATIHGHNEFANKACPCFDVSKEFKNF